MKYRKKPVVIEAFQLGSDAPPQWFSDALGNGTAWYSGGGIDGFVTIKTLEGDHRANFGDWIIQGVKGELYPCRADIFVLTYEAAP